MRAKARGLRERLWAWWSHWFLLRDPAPRTQAFCPGCRNDLVSCPDTTCTDTDLVRYVCGQCGARTGWLFGAPVPLLVEVECYPETNP